MGSLSPWPVIRHRTYSQQRRTAMPYALQLTRYDYGDGTHYYDFHIFHQGFKRGKWSMYDMAFDSAQDAFDWLYDVASRNLAPGLTCDLSEQQDVSEALRPLFETRIY